MQVKVADNGWPGIFIPGDEALRLSWEMGALADAIERGEEWTPTTVPDWLRRRAAELRACEVKAKP
jgi:hypothetical protein